jgi:hypothetical protein
MVGVWTAPPAPRARRGSCRRRPSDRRVVTLVRSARRVRSRWPPVGADDPAAVRRVPRPASHRHDEPGADRPWSDHRQLAVPVVITHTPSVEVRASASSTGRSRRLAAKSEQRSVGQQLIDRLVHRATMVPAKARAIAYTTAAPPPTVPHRPRRTKNDPPLANASGGISPRSPTARSARRRRNPQVAWFSTGAVVHFSVPVDKQRTLSLVAARRVATSGRRRDGRDAARVPGVRADLE